ncbi:MAG: Hsp70 family protein, partial [Pseudonocardia sp.]
MSGYRLGIDLGSTRTTLAVHRPGRPTEAAGGPVPTVVHAGADGTVEIGEPARARALTQPERVVTGFVRRVGDPTPVLLGREPVAAGALVARFLARMVEPVVGHGEPPAGIVVARPTDWGPHRVAALDSALAGAFGRPVVTVAQAVAAAHGHGRYEPGALVAVHDLGGSTCTTAVVRVLPGGAELVAPPEAAERFGGDDVDEAVFAHVRLALADEWAGLDGGDPAVRAAVARLRRECTAAKERLSADTETTVRVAVPGLPEREVRMARAELEEAIRGPVVQTVDALSRALESAGVAAGDLADVLLVGGSARIPLVTEVVSAGLARAVTVAADGVVAAGAATWAPSNGRPVAARPGAAVGGGAGWAAPPDGAAGTSGVSVGPGGAGIAGAPGGPGDRRGGGTQPLDRVPATAADAGGPTGQHPGAGDRLLADVVARPPKQALAFPTEAARPSRAPLFVGIALLVLTVLGGLVVIGASRYAAQNSAVATTPTATPAGNPGALPPSSPPAPRPSPRRSAAPAPPPATAPPAPPPATTTPPASPPPPADGGNNNGGGNNGGGNNGGNNNGGGNNGGGADNGGNNNGGGNNGGGNNNGGGADNGGGNNGNAGDQDAGADQPAPDAA